MKFYSTNDKSLTTSFEEAIFKGLAKDKGLFLPQKLPQLPTSLTQSNSRLSFTEIAFQAARCFLHDEMPDNVLLELIENAFPFSAPIVELSKDLYTLELFHGPTLAFKDFGARFMASIFEFYLARRSQELTVLVATSGDTGSAVAQAFHNKPGINVVILYPSKKVSLIQEMQLTTLGGNVKAIEIEGNFDDCQRIVKEAFSDPDISSKLVLTSANSINIARLIPQSFYYISAFHQLPVNSPPIVFSVPSGNFGNLTAGIMAHLMGLPVSHFVASTNANDVVPQYLSSGIFETRPSIATISNAMDVGNPSNFARLMGLFQSSKDAICKSVSGYSVSDEETKLALKEIYEKYGYLADPHGAVGYIGLKRYINQKTNITSNIFLETAHPAKFYDTVNHSTGANVDIPERLSKLLDLQKQSYLMRPELKLLKEFLMA